MMHTFAKSKSPVCTAGLLLPTGGLALMSSRRLAAGWWHARISRLESESWMSRLAEEQHCLLPPNRWVPPAAPGAVQNRSLRASGLLEATRWAAFSEKSRLGGG